MKADTSDVIEGIIWLVVILIWFISNIVKGRKKKKSAKLSQAEKQEDRRDRQQSSRRKAGGLLSGNLKGFFKEIAMLQKRESSPQTQKPPGQSFTLPAQPRETKPPLIAPEEIRHKSFSSDETEGGSGMKLSGDELRRAIIYSEIIGPPVALRSDERRF